MTTIIAVNNSKS